MIRRLVSVVIVLMVLAIGGAQASAQKTRSTPEDAILAADQQWLKVFAAKDLEKSVAFCADDGSVLAPNTPIATGKEAIGRLFSGFFALPGLQISWHPAKAEVAKSGELSYTSGTYQMTFNDPSGKPITDKGKYVTVWKKQSDGSWKVLLDIFNSDLPVTAASP
jgi:ketosteroid isomerase-like protein